MIRKQVYLTPEIDRELIVAARREGKAVAEVIREILQKSLKIKKIRQQPPASVLFRITGMVKKSPGDLSTNLFDYLYGDKSPNYGKNKPVLTKTEEKRAEKFIDEQRKKNIR